MRWTDELKHAMKLTVTVLIFAGATLAQEPVIREIIISIPDRKLALLENGQVTHIFPIAVGKGTTPSPAGEFQIVNRITDPGWWGDGKAVPAGPKNPLGNRWMGLNQAGFGIHGTNVQSSVGKAASHGCFRMKKADVEELFNLVRVGDAVHVIGERNDLIARIFSTEVQVASAATVETAGAGN